MNLNPALLSVLIFIIATQVASFSYSQDSATNQDNNTTDQSEISNEYLSPKPSKYYVDIIDSIKTTTGRPPTLSEFRELLLKAEHKLTSQEYETVWATFIGTQNPAISLDDLRQLKSKQRDSIATFHAHWTMEFTKNRQVSHSNEEAAASEYHFWMDASKLRLDIKSGPSLEDIRGKQSRSYDGYTERVYNHNLNKGVIHPVIASSHYFDSSNPLWVSKLIDSQRDLAKTKGGLENFSNRNAYPLEGTVKFNGLDCIQLVESNTVYYLSPSMNYAYCGLESGKFSFNEVAGKLEKTESYLLHQLEGFQDCGDGIWLPSLATETSFVNGKVDTVVSIKTKLAKVNEPIDQNVFGDIFPNGTDVFDGINSVAYIQESSKPVEENPVQVVVKRPSDIGWLVIVTNVLAISFVLILIARKSLRKA